MELESIDERHREAVFQIMEVCNLDIPQAIELLKNSGYNTDRAIQNHFNPGAALNNVPPPQFEEEPAYDPYAFEEQEDDPDPVYRKYKKFMQSGISFKDKYKVDKPVTKSLLSWLPSSLRGEEPGGEWFLNRLEESYPRINKVKFHKGTFYENLAHSDKQKFPLAVLLYNFEQPYAQSMKRILSDEVVSNYLSVGFRNLGLDARDYPFEKQMNGLVKKKDVPCIAVFRVDFCKDMSMLGLIPITKDMNMTELRKKLAEAKSKCIREEMNEAAYEKKYKNELQGIYQPVTTFQQKRKMEEERRLKREQEAELLQSNKLYEEQKKVEQKQQEQLKKVEIKIQQAKKTREHMRNTLPTFSQGIHFKFRLPSGDSLLKTVAKNQTVQLLFDYITAHEECGFQHDEERIFEIMRPYDRLKLGELRQQTLEEVFGDTDNQNLIVSEQSR